MSKISLSPNASGTGTFSIASPNSNTDRTLTLPDNSGTVQTQLDQGFGFRNRIINGDMRIDQRNAGASVTYDGSSGYSLDRYFSAEIGNGSFTVQQVSDAPTGFTKSLKVTVTAAQSGTLNAATLQAIEGFNIADFAWGTASAVPVTLSFWVKSSVAGTLGGVIQNSAGNRSYPFTYVVSSTNTWEQKVVTIPGDTSGTWLTDNSAGLWLRFTHGTSNTGTAGAWAAADYRGPSGATWIIQTLSATWQVTGVQLEAGSVATPFERRPYGTELALCQRYFEVLNFGSTAGARWTAQDWTGYVGFNATKRVSPSVAITSGVMQTYANASFGNTTISLWTAGGAATTSGVALRANGGAADYQSAIIVQNTAVITASAEL
jgi:hypothetical protein